MVTCWNFACYKNHALPRLAASVRLHSRALSPLCRQVGTSTTRTSVVHINMRLPGEEAGTPSSFDPNNVDEYEQAWKAFVEKTTVRRSLSHTVGDRTLQLREAANGGGTYVPMALLILLMQATAAAYGRVRQYSRTGLRKTTRLRAGARCWSLVRASV